MSEMHKKRLRERYNQTNLKGFKDYEVIELLLSFANVRKDTKQIAKDLIERFENITNIFKAPIELLMTVKGVGERSATILKLVNDISVFQKKELLHENNPIKKPEAVIEFLTAYFRNKSYEEFVVIYLNTRNIILNEETLFYGTINQTHIYIRKIIENILKYNASSIIISHNHPSGTIHPSESDILLTEKIKYSLSIIDVKLLDHIIIAKNNFFSFNQKGLI